MKKLIKNIFLILLLLNFTSCVKRNFYPDADDPGLSRFTSYGFNVVTEYINGVSYINPFSATRGNSLPFLRKISTNSAFDTLSLSWQIEVNGTQSPTYYFDGICILIPVSKTFNQNDFLALSGQKFDSTKSAIQLNFGYIPDEFPGIANVYFVKIYTNSNDSIRTYTISGLFNGNIGSNTVITDGRFDFQISSVDLNF
ncbi:MAG TPA: hypothetical protein VK787_09450 [Puia sp.]|jgi:hypothetical protein|nr:hypothetical protein [Puia sp.]